MVGWCDGAELTSSAGASYNLDTVGQGRTALAVGAGGGCLNIFTLLYPFSPLSPSLRVTARYRLKNCLKGPLNPEQPNNQRMTIEKPDKNSRQFPVILYLSYFLQDKGFETQEFRWRPRVNT